MHDRCSEVSPSTVNRDLTALKRLYGSAYEIELTDRHLLSGVKPFREFTKERRLLSFEEYLKLIECCAFVPHTDPFVLTLFVVVLGETGCRKSEALHLRRDDCDLTQNTAALNRVKGRRGHLVPMSGRLAQMLRAGKGTNGYVLANAKQQGRRLVDPKRGFRTAARLGPASPGFRSTTCVVFMPASGRSGVFQYRPSRSSWATGAWRPHCAI